MTRQIVLDTETTGLDPQSGHRVIEIGCVEIVNRRLTGSHYHQYVNPEREIDEAAIEVHGLTADFLADKPTFSQVAAQFLEFVQGSELIIHNAPFDLGFLNHELKKQNSSAVNLEDSCSVIDTLVLARSKHPGQRNNLDALCKRYEVDNSQRELHGALLDAEILADVYLIMTGGQTNLQLGSEVQPGVKRKTIIRRVDETRKPLPVLRASAKELKLHKKRLEEIEAKSGNTCLWLQNQEN